MRELSFQHTDSLSSQNWNDLQDVFDEETCRYVLNEIGQRIVPCFPFALGIEEVYAMIVERYGLEQAADVISVLQELLEDDQNASGCGDDGDIWRSWRHSWRHRNDDAEHPFIPRVKNIILRSPTSAHIRRQKACNFLQQQQRSKNVRRSSVVSGLADNIVLSVLPSVEADYMRIPSTPDEIVFEVDELTVRGEESPQRGRTRSSRLLRTPDPVVSFHSWSQFPVPPSARTIEAWFSPAVAGQEDGAPSGTGLFLGSPEQPGYGDHSHDMLEKDNAARVSHCPTNCRTGTHPPSSDVVQETFGHLRNRTRCTKLGTRSENRQARLVDGKIFTFRNKNRMSITDHIKGGAIRPIPKVQHSASENCITVREPLPKGRTSWLRSIRDALLRRSTHNLQATHRRHLSLPGLPKSNIMACTKMSPPASLEEKGKEPSAGFGGGFGLDGSDDRSTMSSHVGIDLNKPLPRRPEGMFLSAEVKHQELPPPSRRREQSPSLVSPSPNLSSPASKLDIDGISRELRQSLPGNPPELTPIEENETADVNALEEYGQMTTPKTCNSPGYRDSLIEESATRSPAVPPLPLEFKRKRTVPRSSDSNSLPHSRSAPSLNTQSSGRHTKTSESNAHSEAHLYSDAIASIMEQDLAQKDRVVTEVDVTKHGAGNESPTKAKKDTGPRSPIKKLFGFGKREASCDPKPDQSPQLKTPASAQKSSIKKWGEKLRMCFSIKSSLRSWP